MDNNIGVKAGDTVMVKAWNQREMCFKCNLRKVRSVKKIAPNGEPSDSYWVYCDNGGAYDSRFVSVMNTVNV